MRVLCVGARVNVHVEEMHKKLLIPNKQESVVIVWFVAVCDRKHSFLINL